MDQLFQRRLLLAALAALLATPVLGARFRELEEQRLEWNPNLTRTEAVEYLLQDYDKRLPPLPDAPTIVKIGIYVNSFDSISEQSMDYAINIYLRQNWTDPRLALPADSVIDDDIKLEDGMWNKLWIPDVFFRNEKMASFHDITVSNRLMTLDRRGNIWYVTKITAVLSCPMRLYKYPLDTQMCPMMFESFGFTTKTVDFEFLPEGKDFELEKALTIPQFQLIGHELIDCSQNYTTGSYPCLQVNFKLKRDVGYFLIQMYIPSTLIVILSWVSFWISADAIPARVSLGLLTVLTMTTQAAGSRSQLPKVSYIKAYDVWMSMCLIFVFASLLEFAVVNVFSRAKVLKASVLAKQKKKDSKAEAQMEWTEQELSYRKELQSRNNDVLNRMQAKFGEDKANSKKSRYMRDPLGRIKARRVDKVARKLFPAVFVVFNIVYWITYTTIPDF